MATQNELMAAGFAAMPARMLGQELEDTLSAAGTTQATATSIRASIAVFTTVAANSGGVLGLAYSQPITVVINAGANTLTVYPLLGEKLNNLAINAGVQIASGKSALFVPANNRWAVIIGA